MNPGALPYRHVSRTEALAHLGWANRTRAPSIPLSCSMLRSIRPAPVSPDTAAGQSVPRRVDRMRPPTQVSNVPTRAARAARTPDRRATTIRSHQARRSRRFDVVGFCRYINSHPRLPVISAVRLDLSPSLIHRADAHISEQSFFRLSATGYSRRPCSP